jgi:hypothetical protein
MLHNTLTTLALRIYNVRDRLLTCFELFALSRYLINLHPFLAHGRLVALRVRGNGILSENGLSKKVEAVGYTRFLKSLFQLV